MMSSSKKISTRVHNKIPYKTHISDFFLFGKLTE